MTEDQTETASSVCVSRGKEVVARHPALANCKSVLEFGGIALSATSQLATCARPNNAEKLKATIRATWALITPEQCHRLIDSMPRHIAAVIQAKGALTKY